MPLYSGFRAPDLSHRGPYNPGFRNPDRDRYHGRDHRRGDHDRHGYGYPYATWAYPYPWVSSFTLSGWDDEPDYAAPNAYSQAPDYAQAPYAAAAPYPYDNTAPDSAPMPSGRRPVYEPTPAPQSPPPAPATANNSAASREPLTLIFKDGRAPEKIQNYIMSGTTLTNLDPQHFEEIPLDDVDVAATRKLNRAHGIIFEVPGATGE